MQQSVLMRFFELAEALGGASGEALVFAPVDRSFGFSSVCIDSREVKEGSLFVALRGKVQDGHRYVAEAFSAGAAGALVERTGLENRDLGLFDLARKNGKALIAVENTLYGLQEAARVYLSGFKDLVRVGITGSSGKTTTKEIAAAIVGKEKPVLMNSGNLNSETGLPLSVFGIRASHEAAILELGMNRRGEIAELTRVFNPCIALITNIGTAHIGIFRHKQAIALEKKAIFSRFRGDETALIPSDDEYRDFLAEGIKGRVRFYDLEAFSELGPVKDLGILGFEIHWEGKPAQFPLPGQHNFRNALAAIAIAHELGIGGRAVREGLESVKPLFGRGEILEGKVTLIRDCYNANPESAAAAIAFCDSVEPKGRRVYVMGSMMELGDCSREAHRQLGLLLLHSRGDLFFFYGEETLPAAEVLRAARRFCFHTNIMEELEQALRDSVKEGDYVLLKGSRSCALERLTDVLLGAAR